ncbi:uncharacterized protein LOC122366683 [Amphibalanus amphitrite]|uniref:uncharacterized protein LOC122366683 n=1 Tax=Amphibalanus amphitrite TaxID=1232801 RepID=UPI001C9060E7|nr:uncharacterized protein LOC122366683 [Amphibalanus amphitrite]
MDLSDFCIHIMNNQENGFNLERVGQKRERDDDEMDSECLPISKRINSLSLNTQYGQGVSSNGWSAAGPSNALPTPSPSTDPPLHMPVLVNGSAPAPVVSTPAPAPLPAEPDLSPEECPEYFSINCYLYQLHMERLRRRQAGVQF